MNRRTIKCDSQGDGFHKTDGCWTAFRKSYNTVLHENETDGFVADVKSQTDGLTAEYFVLVTPIFFIKV